MATRSNSPQQFPENSNTFEKLGLLLIIAVAAIIRLQINFSTQLMPGINAPYYLVQVRSILENGTLGFPDLPLVFYTEAFFAKLLNFAGLCDFSGCIMISSKIIDALLYPLIAIPLFLLANSVAKDIKAPRWIPLLTVVLVTMSTPAIVMIGELQKNSIGLVWAMFYIYFLYKGVGRGRPLDYLWAGAFFVLTGLTHLGALGFCLAFSASFLFFSITLKHGRKIDLIKMPVLLLLTTASISAFLLFFDPERLGKLVSVILFPIKMFERPIIFAVLNGATNSPLQYLTTIPIVTSANLLAILGLVLFVRKRGKIVSKEKILLLTSLTVTIFMASPLLGAEWAGRLYLMAYIPAAIVSIFLLKYTSTVWKKLCLVVLMLPLMIALIPVVLGVRPATSITNEAYNDLFKLKNVIGDPERTLIITRHGLEWWAAWTLRVNVSQGWNLTKESFKNYDNIYYLRQKTDQGNFGLLDSDGLSFPEVVIPPNAEIVYEDELYILAKTQPGPQQFYYEQEP